MGKELYYGLHISGKFITFVADMGTKAITLDEQITLLQSRGMIIADVEKAKEVLLDVGYYRLGFYWFPFQKSGKQNNIGSHEFKDGTTFEDAVRLYYFDYELRSLLEKYITRIEVNFRTYMTYMVSIAHEELPTWFVSPSVVERAFVNNFDKEVYTPGFKRNKFIARHHHNHINDRYAPAWKTLEFMTFGSTIALYKALTDLNLKKEISRHFGIIHTGLFENYMDVVRCVRNTCAHGGVIYDIALFPLIRKGPAGINGDENFKLYGAIKVIRYLLSHVSENRAVDLDRQLSELVEKHVSTSALRAILTSISGFPS